MAELTEEAKVGMVAELKRLAGSTDEFFLRSILESNNFDFQACTTMLAENLQAAQAMEVDVQLHFEEQQYSYQMKRTDTVETLKLKVQEDTNIVPREQMLVLAHSQEEPPSKASLGDVAPPTGPIVCHLLTPNSAA